MRAAGLFLPLMGCSILVEQDLYLAWQYTRADPNVFGTDDVTMRELAPHVGSVGKGEMPFPILSITTCGRKESWLCGCKGERVVFALQLLQCSGEHSLKITWEAQ